MYSFDYTPSFDGNLPQVDHIFPQSELRKVEGGQPQNGVRQPLEVSRGRTQPARELRTSHQGRERYWRKVRHVARGNARETGQGVP